MASIQGSKELTAERFAHFLTWLDPDMGQAVAEYERLRYRLTTFFTSRRCLFADELADEVIDRIACKIDSEIIENKRSYAFGIARNVFLEYLRRERSHVNIDDISVASKPVNEDPEVISRHLEKCLEELPVENRRLILNYMSESKRAKIDLHKQISKSLNTSQTALRMKILRIKKQLRSCLDGCMA